MAYCLSTYYKVGTSVNIYNFIDFAQYALCCRCEYIIFILYQLRRVSHTIFGLRVKIGKFSNTQPRFVFK